MKLSLQALSVTVLLAVAGCTSASETSKPELLGYAAPERLSVCHGYGCTYRTKLDLGATDGARFRAIMARGKASPAAERAAISKAVTLFRGPVRFR